jgi:glycosyltransferase involved in cell wall biosynthesis
MEPGRGRSEDLGDEQSGIDAAPVRRRVAFIINSLAGGGAERVMATFLRASEPESRSFDLSLILLDRETPAYEAPAFVPIHQLDTRFSLLRSVVAVYRALKADRPDVTVSFLTRANVANVLAARLLGIPAIISERVNTSSHLGDGLGGAFAKLIVRATYGLARRIIAVSPGVADDLARNFGIQKAKLAVISNPIDLETIQRDAARAAETPAIDSLGGNYVAAMGRLVPNKNFGMLIEAFAQSGIPGQLLILGDGPERPALERRIAELGLNGHVLLPGFSANPFPLLRAAKCFVLPSNAEGFPNSLLEAMAIGVPVISTNCASGPSEVLADLARGSVVDPVVAAKYGILVQPNTASAMAEALKRLEDRTVRERYAEQAVIRAREFSIDRAKREYWSIISSALP